MTAGPSLYSSAADYHRRAEPPPPDPGRMPGPPANLAALSKIEWEEPIYIPETARYLPLRLFPASVPTRYFLNCHDFWRAGDLDGWSLMDIRALRWCDLGTLAEVLHLVRTFQQTDDHCSEKIQALREARLAALLPKPQPPRRFRQTRRPPVVFNVPEPIRTLSFRDLPVSVRLANVLAGLKLHCLGDLHNRPQGWLQAERNCGAKTVAELVRLIDRAVAGEFFPPATGPAEVPAELVRTLDTLLATLSERNREILRLRLVGQDGCKLTLAAVAQKIGVTRERVRQIVRTSLDRLRRNGSVRLRWLLEQVTAERLGEGLPAATGHFPLIFYVRLIGCVQPGLKIKTG